MRTIRLRSKPGRSRSVRFGSALQILIFLGIAGILCPSALAAEVSPTGAFRHSIPIHIPRGSAGVQPRLDLSYTSGGRNGLLGVGWNLGGLPVIQRISFAGRAVNNKSGDYYAGPGGRLIDATGTGAAYFGESGGLQEYIPVGNCGYGNAAGGPCEWIMKDGRGNTLTFGGTTDSRIEAVGGPGDVVRVWALSRFEDPRGNAYEVEYLEDTATGAYVPLRIVYTKGAGISSYRTIEFKWEARPDTIRSYSGGSLETQDRRLQAIVIKSAGEPVRRYVLTYGLSTGTGRSVLKSVQEFGSDDTTAKPAITFDWMDAELPGFTRLAQDATGATAVANWAQYTTNLTDLNGDGKADILAWNNTFQYANETWQKNRLHMISYLSNGDGTFRLGADQRSGALIEPYKCKTQYQGEFNGDGIPDLMILCLTKREVGFETVNARLSTYVQLGNGDGSFREVAMVDPAGEFRWQQRDYIRSIRPADVNGDGMTDLISFFNVHTYGAFQWPKHTLQAIVWLANGDGTFTRRYSPVQPPGEAVWEKMMMSVQDMTGDGIADIVAVDGFGENATALRTKIMPGDGKGGFLDGPYIAHWGLGQRIWKNYSINFADANGDGLPDIIAAHTKHESSIYGGTLLERFVFLNAGNGKFARLAGPESDPEGRWWKPLDLAFTDVNGDGLADFFAHQGKAGGTNNTRRGTFAPLFYMGQGDGRFTRHILPADATEFDFYVTQTETGDVDGDGEMDVVFLDKRNVAGALPRTVFRGNGPARDLITAVHNGVGGTIALEYQPTNWHPGAVQPASAAPGRPGVSPRMLVVRMTESDGRGAQYATAYQYTDGRVHSGPMERAAGLPPIYEYKSLGFREVRSTQESTGGYSVSRFRQDPQATGTPLDRKVYTAGGRLLEHKSFGASDLRWCNLDGCESTGDPLTHNRLEFGEALSVVYNLNKNSGQTMTVMTSRVASRDAYGHPTKTTQTITRGGAVLASSATVTAYINDRGAGVFGLPFSETKCADAACAKTLQTSATYFDGQGAGAVGSRLLPTKAVITRGSLSMTTTSQFDATGNLVASVDPQGRRTEFTYDSAFRAHRVSVTENAAHRGAPSVKAAFDHRFDLPLTQDTVSGLSVIHQYDALGRPLSKVAKDPSGDTARKTTYSYSLIGPNDGNYTRECVHFGGDFGDSLCSTAYLDGMGRQYKSVAPGGGGILTSETVHDDAGRPAKTIDPLGNLTQRIYDAANRVTEVRKPDGKIFRYRYDDVAPVAGAISVETMISPRGKAFRRYRNANGNIVRVEEGNNSVNNSYVYDDAGRLTQLIGPDGKKITVAYDSAGRRIAVTDPNMGTTSFRYYDNNPGQPSFGQLREETRAHPHEPDGTVTTSYEYDALGRMSQNTASDGTVLTLTYDESDVQNGRDRLTTTVYSQGDYRVRTRFSYDFFGTTNSTAKTVYQKDAELFTATYSAERDELGRARTVTYPDSSVLSYRFDGYGNLAGIAMNGTDYATYHDYDERGKPGRIEFQNGVATDYTYKRENGLLEKIKTAGQEGVLLELSYEFDAANHVAAVRDGVKNDLTMTYEYDDLGRMVRANRGDGNVYEYGFDSAGNLINKATLASNGQVSQQDHYYHAGTHRLKKAGDGPEAVYSAFGNMIEYGTTRFEYDHRNRKVAVRENGYKKVINVHEQDERRVAKIYRPEAETEIITYYLGGNYEIRSKWEYGALVKAQSTKYIMGLDGKRLASVTTGDSLLAFNELHHNHIQMQLAEMMNAKSVAGVVAKIGYHWAAFEKVLVDRPVAVLTQAGLNGLLIVGTVLLLWALVVSLWGRAFAKFIRRRFDWQLEFRAIRTPFAIRNPRFALTAVLMVPMFFSTMACDPPWSDGPDNEGITSFPFGLPYAGPAAEQPRETTAFGLPLGTFFYHDNHVGSASVVTDATGAETSRITYLPYGEIDHAMSPGSGNLAHKFTGQEHDPETGLYYYGARHYSPELGVFTASDTIVPDPEKSQALNRYMYVYGNPVKFTDPTGHYPYIDDGLGGGVGPGNYTYGGGSKTVPPSNAPANAATTATEADAPADSSTNTGNNGDTEAPADTPAPSTTVENIEFLMTFDYSDWSGVYLCGVIGKGACGEGIEAIVPYPISGADHVYVVVWSDGGYSGLLAGVQGSVFRGPEGFLDDFALDHLNALMGTDAAGDPDLQVFADLVGEFGSGYTHSNGSHRYSYALENSPGMFAGLSQNIVMMAPPIDSSSAGIRTHLEAGGALVAHRQDPVVTAHHPLETNPWWSGAIEGFDGEGGPAKMQGYHNESGCGFGVCSAALFGMEVLGADVPYKRMSYHDTYNYMEEFWRYGLD
jgi:RHS repeat-associated protein